METTDERFERTFTKWERMIHNLVARRTSNGYGLDYDDLMQECRVALWRAMCADPEREWHGGEVKACIGFRLGDLTRGKRQTGEPKRPPGQPNDPLRVHGYARESIDELNLDQGADDPSAERVRAWAFAAWMRLASPSAEDLALRDLSYELGLEERVHEALEAVSTNGNGAYDETIADFARMKASEIPRLEIEERLGKKYSTLEKAWFRRTRPQLREALAPLANDREDKIA